MRTRLILTALIAFAAVPFARAQTTKPADQTAPAPTPAVTPAPAPATATTPAVTVATPDADATASVPVTRNKDTLSVDFPEEEIRTILRNVADLFELNLVIPDSLQGKTSIKLRDVSWRQIFQVILSPVGYTFIEDGNIIKIVSQDSLQQEPTTTEVFVLSYARSTDILPTITALVDSTKGGKIVVDSRSNGLVITERPSQLNRIRPIIEKLDKATDQVMIESKFVEVQDNDLKNLGVNWTSLSNYQLGLSNLQQTVAAGSIPGAFANTVMGKGGSQVGGVTSADTAAPAALPGAQAVFSASDFNLVLSALQTQSNTKIVSNPTVVTLNNTEAIINVGEEDPIPQYSYNQQTGSYVVSGFEYKAIGIILKVTPQVNARGFIKLILEPEVSQKLSTVSATGGIAIPIIGTRKAITQVSLKDGYTMALGGLLSSSTTKGSSKVPLLGDIPLLGNIFKSKTDNTTSTNLIIFITAKTVSADGAAITDVIGPDQLRGLDISRRDLPGYRDGSDPYRPDVVPVPAVKKANSLSPFK